MTIPQHVAIIMDGNGRWAKQRGLPRTVGHKQGAENLKRVLKFARDKGVKIVTLYAFSSENWSRPKEEVDTLMGLFREYLKNDISELAKNNVRISFIGNRLRFEPDLQEQMTVLENETCNCDGFHVVLALSYGARDDIVCATQKLTQAVVNRELSVEDIDVNKFSSCLSTAGWVDPDLVIRTSGEERISNFLLWEIAYAELYFSPVNWPDFDDAEFDKALLSYQKRQRRFGGLG